MRDSWSRAQPACGNANLKIAVGSQRLRLIGCVGAVEGMSNEQAEGSCHDSGQDRCPDQSAPPGGSSSRKDSAGRRLSAERIVIDQRRLWPTRVRTEVLCDSGAGRNGWGAFASRGSARRKSTVVINKGARCKSAQLFPAL